MKKIPLQYLNLYFWNFKKKKNIINIIIPLEDENLNENDFEINIDLSDSFIEIIFQDYPSIILGKLFSNIQNYAIKVSNKLLVIALVSESNIKWNSLIISPHKKNQLLDPQSAFMIFSVNYSSKDFSLIPGSFIFLEMAISYGYPPALLAAYDIYSKIPNNKERAELLLKIASEEYDSIEAHFQLALNIIEKNGDLNESYNLLMKSSLKGHILSKSFLGFMLSPLSDINFNKKDPIKAIQYFEEVLKIKEDPTTLYEYSKLLYNGIGIKKNIEQANLFYLKAKSLSPNIPNIQSNNYQLLEKRIEILENKVDSIIKKIDFLIKKN